MGIEVAFAVGVLLAGGAALVAERQRDGLHGRGFQRRVRRSERERRGITFRRGGDVERGVRESEFSFR